MGCRVVGVHREEIWHRLFGEHRLPDRFGHWLAHVYLLERDEEGVENEIQYTIFLMASWREETQKV